MRVVEVCTDGKGTGKGKGKQKKWRGYLVVEKGPHHIASFTQHIFLKGLLYIGGLC